MKNKEETNVNKKKLNEILNLSSKILKVFYIVIIACVIFLITVLCKELGIFNFIFTILKICMPLLIGFLIAWVFNPIVNWLEKKGLKRVIGTIIVFLGLVLLVVLFLVALIPLINSQFNDLIGSIPSILNKCKELINDFFANIKDSVDGFDINSIRLATINSLEGYVKTISINLPNTILKLLSSLVSGIGFVFISIIIGFYMLVNFNSISKYFISLFPKKYRYEIDVLLTKISSQSYNFVKGTLIISSVIFITSSLAFWIIGLKAPLLFGAFCGITNVIPYIGPYIGAVPAVIVGLTQSTSTGILATVCVFVIQQLDGNFFTPYIMGKKMQLHPVTIMLGLMLFGHFFGIFGMIISTPLIALLKTLLEFFIRKFDIFNYDEDYEEKKKKSIIIGREKSAK